MKMMGGLSKAVATAMVGMALTGCVTLEQEVAVDPNAAGMPLDAIVYKAPTFADGDYCYRVRDRQSNCEWWLVWLDGPRNEGGWIVLPLTEGEPDVG